jgi:hypothetical protein
MQKSEFRDTFFEMKKVEFEDKNEPENIKRT